MTHARHFIGVLILILLCLFTSQAQQTRSPSKEADEAVREKAFELLESLAGQIGILQSTENRARLGANLVDSLWAHDEQRARTLLVSVQNDINAGFQGREGDGLSDEQRRMVFMQLRINTVERIAKHDGELALAFFRATERPVDPADSSDNPWRLGERAFELRLANNLAATNPEIALNLARRSLAGGFSSDVIPLLRQLNRKHKEQALVLYDEIVTKLKRVNLSTDDAAFDLAATLARSFTPPAIDDARFRDVINLLVNSAIANGCNGKMSEEDERTYFCQRIGSLLPLIKRVDATRAANFKRWEPEADEEEGVGYSYEIWQELSEIEQNGTADEILALTKKYPQMEEAIAWRALQKAQASGGIEQARKFANDFTGNPAVKQAMLERLDRQETAVAEFRNKQTEIQAALDSMKNNEERVRFLIVLAEQIATKDSKQSAKFLDQANELAGAMKPGRDQLGAQILLAVVYCSRGNQRGLIVMETMMPRLNELVTAAAKLDGYENNYLRDGEWNMSREGTLGSFLTGLSEQASYFAWCDFDRAVSIAGQFERPEIRLMAQVKLAQGILAGRPKSFGLNLQMMPIAY
jgi:hypothetical protein